MRQLAQQVIERCRQLSGFTEEPGRTTRTFLSDPMHDVHHLVGEWMRAAGLTVRIDDVGNIRGLAEGFARSTGRFILASHLDTVPNAGAFDGILGVVLAIALAGRRTNPLPFHLEVIGFSEEEGVRFRLPFLGSRALVGTLNEQVLQTADSNGITVAQAIVNYGLPPVQPKRVRDQHKILGYLEFHIEQGPVLESLKAPLGIVDTIAGQSRLEFSFEGRANHAGTTPMSTRQNALTAASEWMLYVERFASECAGLVATNGSVTVQPNATNVVPGKVNTSLDVRHADDATRLAAVAELISAAGRIGAGRNIAVSWETKLDQPAVAMDAALTGVISNAVRRAKYPVHHLISGAGHDAMIVAPFLPASMLFIRSPGGISHHPDENVLVEDVEAALHAGFVVLEELEKLYG